MKTQNTIIKYDSASLLTIAAEQVEHLSQIIYFGPKKTFSPLTVCGRVETRRCL